MLELTSLLHTNVIAALKLIPGVSQTHPVPGVDDCLTLLLQLAELVAKLCVGILYSCGESHSRSLNPALHM